ncbi:hypothetical protein FMK81_10990 [Klebsiella oxytoca]|nr:hypothetical protein [Klebsiella oxytoca]MBZ7712093.1 hypothetical protein [Klebsiella oxytoca]
MNSVYAGPAGARPRDEPSNGERSESIPPHRHILRRARTQVRAFFSPIARHRPVARTGASRRLRAPLLRLQTLFDSLRLVDSGKC